MNGGLPLLGEVLATMLRNQRSSQRLWGGITVSVIDVAAIVLAGPGTEDQNSLSGTVAHQLIGECDRLGDHLL
jgi:hypothetical protein